MSSKTRGRYHGQLTFKNGVQYAEVVMSIYSSIDTGDHATMFEKIGVKNLIIVSYQLLGVFVWIYRFLEGVCVLEVPKTTMRLDDLLYGNKNQIKAVKLMVMIY